MELIVLGTPGEADAAVTLAIEEEARRIKPRIKFSSEEGIRLIRWRLIYEIMK